ncbi:MAG TPA: serine/threonine-protein kinase [Ignavibacteriaceae bacterium]|nr:serine/threonine-protein kinase [Ignavibacteriaceae bacterium]
MLSTQAEILYDKFEILETIKKDLYTSVYLANHIYLGKKIILKTLNTDELADKTILARFKREAKILALLDHPNLIKVLDFGTYKNNFYISFEYFESKNLRNLIKQNNYTDEQKRSLIIRLMKALNAAHQNHIVHRDIKPENLLVNKRLELKIADFGLALMQEETKLTLQSTIVGTPSYMSPEQIRGEELNPQSDLFSAGIVALELFTQVNPFLGKDINETINKILTFDESEINSRVSNLPDDIKMVITGLLKKNPNDRFKSAEEVLSILGIQASNHNLKVKITEGEKKKGKKYLVAGIIVVILAAVGFFYLNQTGNIEPINESLAKKEYSFSDKNSINIFTETPGSNPNNLPFQNSFLPGKLFVEAEPWAEVFVDNKKIDTTPLDDYIQLKPGTHTLKLVHPNYPPYIKKIVISNDKIESIKVNFPQLTGYLDCKVMPWGEVYINGTHIGTTPLREPINLFPGTYRIKITNPRYNEPLEKNVNITAKETLEVTFSFENQSTD